MVKSYLWKNLEEVGENNINGIVIANEVLDALPVERITFTKGKLRRQAVSIDKKSHKLFFDQMPITSELRKVLNLLKVSWELLFRLKMPLKDGRQNGM